MIPTLNWQDIFAKNGASVPIDRITERHYFYPQHRHDFTELVIILAGSGVQVVGNEEYPITAGDVFVFQHPDAHGFKTTTNIDLVNICPQPGITLPFERDLRTIPGYHVLFRLEPQYRHSHQFESRLHLTRDQLAHLIPLLEQMRSEFLQRQPGRSAIITALYLEVLVYLSRCYATITVPISRYLLQIGGLLSYLEQHYAEPITVPELAERAGVSVSSVLRAFKRATGMAPIDYLLRIRIDRASQLLRDTDLRMTEIATQVGFANSSYFCKQFKRLTGLSPRDFRNAPR